MKFNAKDIRNVAILGHSGEGKTSLAEAILFNGGSIDRLGKTDAGNHWKECVCGGKSELAAHADNNGDNKCDACGYAMSTHTDDTDGLGTGAIIGIIVACVAVVGVGAFVLIRFAINKKKMR